MMETFKAILVVLMLCGSFWGMVAMVYVKHLDETASTSQALERLLYLPDDLKAVLREASEQL